MAEEPTTLAHLAQASMHGRLEFGDGTKRPFRLVEISRPETMRSVRAGTALGFNLENERLPLHPVTDTFQRGGAFAFCFSKVIAAV